MRAVVPVWDGGRVVALVSVGRTVTKVSRDLAARVPLILGTAAAALLLAAAGTWLVSRWLRRASTIWGRARDLAVVQAAVAFGATQYLVKPFTFAAVRAKLEAHREYRERLDGTHALAQDEVDELFGTLRGPVASAGLPKGISRASLDAVAHALESADGGLTAHEAGTALGASRVTARRYLEYLVEIGLGVRRARYGTAGRPQTEYRRRGGGTGGP